MKIKDLVKEAHENAINKGFWDAERKPPELLMLVVSELSEALEADRVDEYASIDQYNNSTSDDITRYRAYISDSFEDEIADCFIRLADLCAGLEVDIEKHIKIKMNYNKSREYLHGKKY